MDDGSGITRRSFLGGVALACGAAGLVMGFPRFALAEASEDELARSGVPYLTSWVGSDVYNTNQLITTNYFRSSEWVVIASGAESSWPDAIVASGVAGMKSAPVVLTPGSGLCEDAEISIRALGAKNAYIIGGTAVISQSVENRLHSIFGPDGQVIRLAGSTCYETAEQAYAAFKAGSGRMANLLGIGGTRAGNGWRFLLTLIHSMMGCALVLCHTRPITLSFS